jgi:hypothetical protein
MKHLFFLIVFSIAFSFCQNKSNNNAELKNEFIKSDTIFRISEHYSKFKFHDLIEFKMDTFHFDGESTKYFEQLSLVACNQIFQHTNEKSLSKTFFYYSTFKDPTLITILEESDDLGFVIWLCKYDEKGKFVDQQIIANHLGDGRKYWRGRGQLIENNTFIHTDIDSWDLENGDEKVDSIIVKIKFNKNNKTQIDTIFKSINSRNN